MKSRDFLSYYATQFAAVEVDSTFYGCPSANTVNNWSARTPEDFLFCVKVPQIITHEKVLVDSEFPLPINPIGPRGPTSIVLGPDGNLWFTERTAKRIGQRAASADPNTQIYEWPAAPKTLAGGPTGISLGPDGNLWFAEHDSDIIGRIRLDGTFNGNPDEFHLSDFLGIGVKRGPVATTAGPDGSVWFTEKDANRIGRLNPWVLP